MAVTKEQIWSAASAIDAGGQKPTLALVRARVGGGSFSTISAAMREWARKGGEEPMSASEPVPAELSERVGEIVAQVWAIAQKAAGEALDQHRQTMAEEKAMVERENVALAEAADELRARLDELEAVEGEVKGLLQKLTASETERELVKVERDVLRRQLDTLTETLQASTTQHHEFETSMRNQMAELAAVVVASQKAAPNEKI
jgi:chromosome segregation ATPase